mmetsp:Transcript_666/g.1550  ORF Transcript_666/g.1550 Transcript_666/m.1550 type:complete len:135 (+) Transcript_666:357-761(+)
MSSWEEVVVDRSYINGTLTQFIETFPDPLRKSGVTETEFGETIRWINRLFLETETYSCFSFMESFAHCVSFYSLHLCYKNSYARAMKQLEQYLDDQNRRVYGPKGVEWQHPIKTGFLFISIRVKIDAKQSIFSH